MKEKVKNVPRSKTQQFYNAIISCTAIAFASMLNEKYRGPNYKHTPEHIASISFCLGFYLMGYFDEARVFPYKGLSTSYGAKEYWMRESRRFANDLLVEAGMKEKGNQDDI